MGVSLSILQTLAPVAENISAACAKVYSNIAVSPSHTIVPCVPFTVAAALPLTQTVELVLHGFCEQFLMIDLALSAAELCEPPPSPY